LLFRLLLFSRSSLIPFAIFVAMLRLDRIPVLMKLFGRLEELLDCSIFNAAKPLEESPSFLVEGLRGRGVGTDGFGMES